jgi:hypothetical protein
MSGRQKPVDATARLDAEEERAMDHLLAFMDTLKGWGLRTNGTEMVSAVHVLQGFVVQHMLQRLDAEAWGNWYAPIRGDMREPRGGA